MKILLVADHPDAASAVERSLREEGHTVTSCNDADGGPCRGVTELATCPLESSVALAVVARAAQTRRGLGEMGSVCATRHRVGVVEIDPEAPHDRSIYDLADEAEAGVRREYVATIRQMLGEMPLPSGSAAADIEVAIDRFDGDVRVRLRLPFRATPIEVTAIADRTRAAVRRHDRFARIIDVSVLHASS